MDLNFRFCSQLAEPLRRQSEGERRYQVVQALGVSHGVLATCFSAERAARRGVQVFTRFA